MSVYIELDPMVEHRTKFTLKGKRQHISKVNMSNLGCPSHILTSKYRLVPGIVAVTVKITFNLDTESSDKARSVVDNDARALVKRKVLMLGSKDIDTINNSDIYDTIFT